MGRLAFRTFGIRLLEDLKTGESEMASKKEAPASTVQKSTMYGVAFVALAVGFFAGVMFSVYRSVPSVPQSGPATPPPAADTSR